MPWTPDTPQVQDAIKALRPEPEQHRVDSGAHCLNPKCGYYFTAQDEQEMMTKGAFLCPRCGYTNDAKFDGAPGGNTKANLTLKDMGNIGETVIEQMGSIPGVGRIIEVPNRAYHSPIDFMIEGTNGKRYGVEVKTNHSEAQPRFKLGGKKERQAKIDYCYKNGLAPVLIGVRLNFFDDQADIFFREGMSDTWIGSKTMAHVGTASFADHNPFRTPEQHAALEASPPPDQSDEDFSAQLDEIFGPVPKKDTTPSGTFSRVYPWDDDWLPVRKATDRKPDWIFVYYMGNLKVEEWHHNRRFADMAEELLKDNGTTVPSFAPDLDSTEFVGGDLYEFSDGSMNIDVQGMSKPEAVESAKGAIMKWMQEKDS